jgi:hypothetical protein
MWSHEVAHRAIRGAGLVDERAARDCVVHQTLGSNDLLARAGHSVSVPILCLKMGSTNPLTLLL